jgi:hypothetical protein
MLDLSFSALCFLDDSLSDLTCEIVCSMENKDKIYDLTSMSISYICIIFCSPLIKAFFQSILKIYNHTSDNVYIENFKLTS